MNKRTSWLQTKCLQIVLSKIKMKHDLKIMTVCRSQKVMLTSHKAAALWLRDDASDQQKATFARP